MYSFEIIKMFKQLIVISFPVDGYHIVSDLSQIVWIVSIMDNTAGVNFISVIESVA